MIIHLNGWPGVGKLTIAQLLADQLSGRALDNHSIYDVAFALTEPWTPTFYDTVRAVREIAYRRLAELPPATVVILTNVLFSPPDPWGEESWQALREVARRRGSALLAVTIDCSLDENLQRLQSPGRRAARKLIDPSPLVRARQRRALHEGAADRRLSLDISAMSPEAAAAEIAAWTDSGR